VRFEYYDVTGRTSTDLITSMEKNGPEGYWAYTDWHVNREYPCASGPDGYKTGPVQVEADVTITLPRWDPPTGVSADLVARWDRLVTALRAHEEGHRDIGFTTGRKVLAALEALPAYTSKEALELAADNAANAIVSDGQARDASYDASTDHGESQGATL
jgi:predicted secreted Zn-dependent protease